MTTPTILPTGYQGTSVDYLHTKCERDGADRSAFGVVTIPITTASATIVGLIPFNTNARLSTLYTYVTDLDTSTNVTMSLGYVYDDNVTYTDKATAFLSASTVPQAGGSMTANTVDPCTWTAAGNGWIVAQVGGGATTSAGVLSFRVGIVYDVGGLPT